jgi:hypothetical protein
MPQYQGWPLAGRLAACYASQSMQDTGVSDIDPLEFRYTFRLPGGRTEVFVVRLDEQSLGILQEIPKDLPDWTRLGYHQCPGCPLKEETTPHCPVAASLVPVLSPFSEVSSTTEADIEIQTATRTFRKKAPVSVGISALAGLHMVTAGCPIMDHLRPMARTHLPFSTHEETTYRVLSMYLLAQFFIKKDGGEADWDMERLEDLMEEVHQVNKTFCERIDDVAEKDANRNALVLLDCFAGITHFALSRGSLKLIRRSFTGYLEGDDEPGTPKDPA